MTKMGINNNFINNHTLKDLKKINSGTKVKRNFIIQLEELINIIPDKKTVIMNIVPYNNNNNINTIVEKANQITKNNRNINWYIISNYKEILDKLSLIKDRNFKIGKFIIEEYDWNFSFEFYIVNKNNINEKIILEKLHNNQIIFINNIDTNEEFDYITGKFKGINIITNHSNKIIYKH